MGSGFYLISDDGRPNYNQALLELLYSCIGSDYTCMLIHSSNNSISIGRNLYCEKPGKKEIYRRQTGLAALFLNPNYINISFICARDYADIRKQSAVVSLALKMCGINCTRTENNNILLENGNTACINIYDKSAAITRQDIFVNIEFENYKKYMQPQALYGLGLQADVFINALIVSFSKLYYKAQCVMPSMLNSNNINELADFFASEQWLYNGNLVKPITENFAWGNVLIDIEVENAIIKNFRIFSDSVYSELIALIPYKLTNCTYLISPIKDRLLSLPYANKNLHVIRDILRLIEQSLATQ